MARLSAIGARRGCQGQRGEYVTIPLDYFVELLDIRRGHGPGEAVLHPHPGAEVTPPKTGKTRWHCAGA